MGLEIVEHDDVALLQSWRKTVFKPGFERLGVHGAVISFRRDDASQTQAKDEGDRFVMAVGHAAAQTAPAPSPTVAARHVVVAAVSSTDTSFSRSRSS